LDSPVGLLSLLQEARLVLLGVMGEVVRVLAEQQMVERQGLEAL
jgi:hypothetical protein